jgi:16S rRNA (cytosine1402-N4)-methyltransferase
VLLNETLELLDLKPGQCAVDGTLGAGGHSAAIIEKLSPGGRLISFDVDPQAIAIAKEKLGPLAAEKKVRHDIVQSNFSDIANVLRNLDAPAPNGIMADLGVSSMQFDTPERGFSFRHDAPLDMRMDPELHETAADILRTASETEIADILYHYGEERASRKIARALVERRKKEPITTTGQLEEFIRYVLRVKRWVRIHPATRTFQALRIAVNHELDVLETFLKTAPEVLSDNGTLAVITFHSLEDRIAKHTFKGLAATGRFSLPVKFVPPSEAEMAANPRSRSAKLRGLRKEPA